MNWDDPIVAKTIQYKVVERLRLAEMENIAESVEVDITSTDRLARGFAAHLTTFVLTEKLLSDSQDVSWDLSSPTTSWQFFKREHENSWWLGWLVRRRPVKVEWETHTEHFTFERYAMFPHSAISHPYMGEPVIFEQSNLPNPKERGRVNL